jgi:hypothetical protein
MGRRIIINIDIIVVLLRRKLICLRLRRLILVLVLLTGLLLQSPMISTIIMHRTSPGTGTFGVATALIDRTYRYRQYRYKPATSTAYRHTQSKRPFLTFQLQQQQQQQRRRISLLQFNNYGNAVDTTSAIHISRYSNTGIIQSTRINRRMKQPQEQRQLLLQKRCMSVSGIIYDAYNEIAIDSNDNDNVESITTTTKEKEKEKIVIKLFTKENCTLCDKVQSILYELRIQYPHVLEAIDITDTKYASLCYERYKYDIPILHINDMYWTKHRITIQQAQEGLYNVTNGLPFQSIGIEPNAMNSRPISKQNK